MSWLSDLAGKAEDILNKIDKNAAVVLKDKTIISDQLTDVIWHNSERRSSTEGPVISRSSSPPAFTSTPLKPVRSGPSNTTIPALRASPAQITNPSRKEDDEELFKFLNGSDVFQQSSYSDDMRRSPSGASVASVGSYSAVGQDSQTESRTNSPSCSASAIIPSRDETENEHGKNVIPAQSINTENCNQGRSGHPRNTGSKPHDASDLYDENEMLRKEIRTLNSEISLLLKRAKAAEEELASLNHTHTSSNQLLAQLNSAQSALRDTEKQVAEARNENLRLQQTVGKETFHSEEEMHDLTDKMEKLVAERDMLTGTAQELTLRVARLQDTVTESSSQCERLRQQLAAAVTETEQYRARATRILQEKEQIIATLQEGGPDTSTGSESMWEKQVEQLRRERALDREEMSQVTEHLRTLREELQDSERRLEESRERATKELDRLQNSLSTERARRIAAEEDSKKNAEEIRATRNEMAKERQTLNGRLREREVELAKLRSPLSPLKNGSSSSSPAELEARVRQLATTLVQKQGALEAVLAERNALRLQLERAHRREPSQRVSVEDTTALCISGEDNGLRSRVPTLLVESPSDTGVTRRVKRAYSTLDTLGIRIGVFLRRYPLVRILVILYVVVLHLWVLLVLLTYTPEGRSNRPQIIP